MLILELAALFALLSIVVALILLVRPEAGQQYPQRVPLTRAGDVRHQRRRGPIWEQARRN